MVTAKRLTCLALYGILTCSSRTRCDEAQVIDAIRFFGQYYESSCVILLYTEDKIANNTNEIYRAMRELAFGFNDFGVAAMTFGRFLRSYPKWKSLRCNSPLIAVTHSDNGTRREMEKVSHTRMFHMTFWLLFMFDKSHAHQFFERIKTPFNLQLVVAETKDPDRMEFFEVYRVLSDQPLRTPRLGHWSTQDGYALGTRNIYERRNNLEGATLRTGSTDNYPIHYFAVAPDGRTELRGFFAEVWRELERILNFTSINYPSVDRVTGIPEENGQWNGLVGMLQRGEIDAAVSIFIMDEQRSHVIDFTRPLLRTSYQIFFKNMGNNFHWDAILRPFKRNIWYTVAGWIIVSSFILWFCHKHSCNHGIEKQCVRDEFTLINSGFFFTKVLCNQGHNCTPSAAPGRIIFLSAYLVAAVLVPSYSAALIYFLTSRSPVRPFDSLRELLQIGTYSLQTVVKTAHYTYFSNSTNPLLHKIFEDLMKKIPEDNLPLSMAEGLERLCTEPNLAHFGDMANAVTFYNEINSRDGTCRIMHLSREISSVYSCLGLARDSPFQSLFNYHLLRIINAGIVDELEKKTFPIKRYIRKTSTWGVIESNDVFQAFVILLVGMGLSMCILVIEVLSARVFRTRSSAKVQPMFHVTRNLFLMTHATRLREFE